MNAKAWWRSRTIWFNLLSALLIVAEQNLHVLAALLPGKLYSLLMFGLPLVNVALRIVTRTAVARRDAEAWP